jgi:hypothetical protein
MWEVKYTNTARDRLRRFLTMVPQVVECVQRHILELASKPSRGRRATFPYPDVGMAWTFHCMDEGECHHFSLHYQYDQSEEAIVIFNIGYSRLV